MNNLEEDVLIESASCPVCSNSQAEFLFRDRDHRDRSSRAEGSYLRCSQCRTIYLADIVGAADGVSDHEASMGPGSEIGALQRELLLDLIENPPPLPSKARIRLKRILRLPSYFAAYPVEEGYERRLLDVGCGMAIDAARFHAWGWNITGIDINTRAVEELKKLLPHCMFYSGFLEDVRLPDDEFDVVFMNNVLEHVAHPKELLMEIRGVLKPGGRLVAAVPSGSGIGLKVFGRYCINYWVPFHLCLFTPWSLRALLEQNGFLILDCKTVSPPDWWILSWRQWRGRFSYTGLPLPLLLRLALLPFTVLSSYLGQGDEVVIVAQKPY